MDNKSEELMYSFNYEKRLKIGNLFKDENHVDLDNKKLY